MARATGDEINTQKHVRWFVQPGGPGPFNPSFYSGQDNAYLTIETADNPRTGGISPINVHDPTRVGVYRRVGRSVEAPDFPTATVLFYQSKDVLPRHLTTLPDCFANFYMVVGDCKDLSDFVGGWSAYVKVFSIGEVTNVSEAGSSFDSDDALQDELEYTFNAVYNVGKLGIGEEAATEVFSEIKAVTYGNRVQCGACGPSDNGTKLIYAAADNTVGSPGEPPSVIYSLNGQLGPWVNNYITGAASTDVPTAIAVAGQYLLVFFDDASQGGYFFTELNPITGAPTTWTKVQTGFVSGSAPLDVYVASAREIWISGEAGYIYRSQSVPNGVNVIDAGDTVATNLTRIHGIENTIVAAGASGNVIYSANRGVSWTTVTTNPSANGNTALAVVDDLLWWVGDDAGDAFYTNDGGESWTDAGLEAASSQVDDILFATDEVAYLAYQTSAPTAVIKASFDGGLTWTTTAPRILNTPVFDYANRLAAPEVPNFNVAANNLAIGGLAGDGTDGVIFIASAATK